MSLFTRFRRTPPPPGQLDAVLQTALQDRDDAQRERTAVIDQLAAAQAEIAALGKALSLKNDLAALTAQDVRRISTTLEKVRAQNFQLRTEIAASAAPATAPPSTTDCACGGDTELYLRRQIVAAEQRATRDRANAIRLDNRLAAAEDRPIIGSLT